MKGKLFSEKSFFNLQLILDYGIILLGLMAAFFLVSGSRGLMLFSYRELVLVVTFFYGVIFTIYKPYTCGKKKYSETMLSLLVSLALLYMVMIVMGYLFKESKIPIGIFLYSFFITALVFSIQKRAMFSLYTRIHKNEHTVIIGNHDTGERIAAKLIQHMDHIHELRYILNAGLLGFERIRDYINQCDIVYLSVDLDEEIKQKIIYYCFEEQKPVYFEPSVSRIFENSGQFTTLDDLPLLILNNSNDAEELVLKRSLDILMSLTGLILASPLLIIGYLGVRLQDGGPAFYMQERLTKDNKTFRLIKFRSMVPDAENETGAVLASENDARITRFGRFLRKSRIDELPQLINVIKGDMSIVGPRPERPELALKYIAEFPEYEYRTRFKSGITGLAQVWGKYNTTFKDKLLLDLYYIKNFSFINDMQILFFTLKIIFKGSATEGVRESLTLEEVAGERNCRIDRKTDGIVELVKNS
jgi:exopolysaccharide biosynthesis polyprenyl glycosylphosphotransferase